jgi:hypothetical protein
MEKAALSGAEKAAKGADIANVASSVGQFAGTAISIIGTITDQNKRRVFESNYALLNKDQKDKLDKLMADASSELERLRILTNALSASNTQRINNIALMYAEAEKKRRNQQIIILIGFLAFAGIATYFIVKKK